MRAVIEEATLASIHDRLRVELAPPGRRYVPWRVGGEIVGWTNAERAARLERFGEVFSRTGDGLVLARRLATYEARTAALAEVCATLGSEGLLTGWRDERYAIGPVAGAPALFELERAAARYFGVLTFAVHLNGLVAHYGDLAMWLARRSPHKPIDPGLLDNLVAGGVRARTSVSETLRREAWEEAGLTNSVIARAQCSGVVQLCREQPDGLQREIIFVHDIRLPGDYTPTGVDGEVVDHRLVSLEHAAAAIAISEGPDRVTADASLVVLDCLLRHAAISPESPYYVALASLRMPPLVPAQA